MQLMSPNVQNSPHQPPNTTSHACMPPSGKSAGFMPGGAAGGGVGTAPPFSRSASTTLSGSGQMLASVSWFCEGMRSSEGRALVAAASW
jgi:hypothetical protein